MSIVVGNYTCYTNEAYRAEQPDKSRALQREHWYAKFIAYKNEQIKRLSEIPKEREAQYKELERIKAEPKLQYFDSPYHAVRSYTRSVISTSRTISRSLIEICELELEALHDEEIEIQRWLRENEHTQ